MKVSHDFCISKRFFSFILVNYISVLEEKELLEREGKQRETILYE